MLHPRNLILCESQLESDDEEHIGKCEVAEVCDAGVTAKCGDHSLCGHCDSEEDGKRLEYGHEEPPCHHAEVEVVTAHSEVEELRQAAGKRVGDVTIVDSAYDDREAGPDDVIRLEDELEVDTRGRGGGDERVPRHALRQG